MSKWMKPVAIMLQPMVATVCLGLAVAPIGEAQAVGLRGFRTVFPRVVPQVRIPRAAIPRVPRVTIPKTPASRPLPQRVAPSGVIRRGVPERGMLSGQFKYRAQGTQKLSPSKQPSRVNKGVWTRPSDRQAGVNAAWREERALIAKQGKGSRKWSAKQRRDIMMKGRANGIHGHHINSVSAHPQLSRVPGNIAFVTGKEHRALHRLHGANTSGRLVDRKAIGEYYARLRTAGPKDPVTRLLKKRAGL